MSRVFIQKTFHRNGKKAETSAKTRIIDEQESPSSNKSHIISLNNTVSGAPVKSPPSKFRRHKSYPPPQKPPRVSPPHTQKKNEHSPPINSIKNFFLSIRSNSKKKRKILAKGTHCENSTDELNVSSNLSQPKVPNQMYEQSTNKHGDVVDYAVPFSEPANNLQSPSGCADVNNDDAFVKLLSDLSVEINEFNLVTPERRKVLITDLDKSSEGSRSIDRSGRYLHVDDRSNKEGLLELDSLQHWSEKIPKRRLPAQEPPVNKYVHIIQCKPKEIKQKLSAFKNTIALPMHFSSGTFRKTRVTLRKGCIRDKKSLGLIEEAMERDYDILNQVKHANIILLMAVSFHRESCEHITLVMEPLDFTLNYYLYHMNKTLSVTDSIAVVQQIASAALYLQQCGFIHSNISSHNILVREVPWCVKLTSFELTTEVDFADTKAEILTSYRHMTMLESSCSDKLNEASAEVRCSSLREQYKQKSRLYPVLKCSPNENHKCMRLKSKHVIYDSIYRQHLSLHNFQAPELLTTKHQFVFPTIKADVYSLCLVLWEMLNYCVPFVVYSKLDMERMIASNKMSLPFFESERCAPFLSIFRLGLDVNPANRNMDVEQLITMLDDVKFSIQPDLMEQSPKHEDGNLYVNATPESKKNSLIFMHSPNLMDFNQYLLQMELTSTKKKRKATPQKPSTRKAFRQLFNGSIQEQHAKHDENVEVNDFLRLKGIAEESESAYNSIVKPVIGKENELPSTRLIEKEGLQKTGRHTSDPKLSDENNVDNSNSCNNLLTASTSASRQKIPHSNFNITSPPNDALNIEPSSLTESISQKNKIVRNAWLSKKSFNLPIKQIDDTVMENGRQPMPSSESNKWNILRNKVVPKKLDSERIKFFDSMEACALNLPISNKKLNKGETMENSDANYSANHPIKDFSSKEKIELESDILNQALCHFESENLPAEPDETVKTFEKKLSTIKSSYRRSSSSSETDDDSKVITPKWQSVQKKILKFEKRGGLSVKPSPTVFATEVRNLSKSLTTASSTNIKNSHFSTSIKAKVCKESKVSDVSSSALDIQPIVNQPDLNGQRIVTQIATMTEICRESSDFNEAERRETEETRQSRENVCDDVDKNEYICGDCASKVSEDDLKTAANLESIDENPLNAKENPTNSQKARSIEDLYIDDDFDQGLGANIELQSDSSDFLHFEITSLVGNNSILHD
ncbi:Tyrosine-protein kinase isoform SRK4 [Pseudolycoriella hygida]|uniref:Tyrosine-protein kinase isoform SRK4 n=1 Tax=Pseudolycoriella hygida TaxID=35572 RepID=A0A9Q0MSA1_9DIPT|nr:Tyrosine-protein kinase isoform SRK4 [Pseudolycoriella hygida]